MKNEHPKLTNLFYILKKNWFGFAISLLKINKHVIVDYDSKTFLESNIFTSMTCSKYEWMAF